MSEFLTTEDGEPLGLEQAGLVASGAMMAESGAAVSPAIDPADAIQAGIFALLAADAGLTALVTGLHDGRAPEDAERDYVVLGAMMSTPDGAHDGEGRQTVAELHTWTESEGFQTANAIGARLVALLWHRHVELNALVDGHTVRRVEHEFAQTLTDPQPGVRHRVDRFRVWTKEDAA